MQSGATPLREVNRDDHGRPHRIRHYKPFCEPLTPRRDGYELFPPKVEETKTVYLFGDSTTIMKEWGGTTWLHACTMVEDNC